MPRLPGSDTPAQITTNVAVAASAGRVVVRWRTMPSTGCGVSVDATRSSTPGARSATGDPGGVDGRSAGRHELHLDLPAGGERLGEQAAAFDHERAVVRRALRRPSRRRSRWTRGLVSPSGSMAPGL